MNNAETILDQLSHRQNNSDLVQPTETLIPKWVNRVQHGSNVLYTQDKRLNWNVIKNFRRLTIFFDDGAPATDFANWNPKYWYHEFFRSPVKNFRLFIKQRLSGQWRGQVHDLEEKYALLEKEGAIDLLKKYDVSKSPGNPFVYRYKGAAFNTRWTRHMYFFNLVRRYVGSEIAAEARAGKRFINMDIGGAHGIFTYIFKSEIPNSTHVVIDFPDQIILTYYFLSHLFPQAKIATALDFEGTQSIERTMLEKYDFVLLPTLAYDKLAKDSVDMVTNFLSFGEMSPEWCRKYFTGASFKTARYFFTCNRFISGPRVNRTYDTSITVRDYPLDEFETVLFDVSPYFYYSVETKKRFFYEKVCYSSQLFDFIGRRRIK